MAQHDDGFNSLLAARDGPPSAAKPRIGLWVAIAIFSLVIAFLAMGHFAGNSPEAQARQRDADVISDCRRQIEDSLTPTSTKEALRYLCSGLRNDYVRKWNREP